MTLANHPAFRKGDPEYHAWRLWEKVDRSGGEDACWPWLRGKSGQIRDENGELEYAWRFAWRIHNGQEIPKGLFVCHACDNGAGKGGCCNPAHLYLGTARRNVADRFSRFDMIERLRSLGYTVIPPKNEKNTT